jgi:hypothetical protein
MVVSLFAYLFLLSSFVLSCCFLLLCKIPKVAERETIHDVYGHKTYDIRERIYKDTTSKRNKHLIS